MKKILCISLKSLMVIALLMFLSPKVTAQDVITKKSGEEIKAKVEQVLDNEIKYRKAENLTGPIYTITKAEVFMIKYENGTRDVFGNQPAPVVTQPAISKKQSFTANDLIPAQRATKLGYWLVVPILGLGITSGAITDNPDLTIPMGAVATLIGAIGIPIVAGGGGKTRRATGVEGNFGLRIAGWIGYGLALSDALYILGRASSGYDTSGGITYSVAILGAASSILMAVDASQTYTQAKSLLNQASIQPTIGTLHDFTGNHYQTVGFKINF